MDAIRREASNFQIDVRSSKSLAATAIVTVLLAAAMKSKLGYLQKLTSWKIEPFKGNVCPNLCFGAFSVGCLTLANLAFEPVKITLKNHHYQFHRKPMAKTCLTTLAFMTITVLSLKRLQKHTEKKIVPLKGHPTANAFFGALSLSYLAGSMFAFKPISRVLPEDIFEGLRGLSETFLNGEFEPLSGERIRELRTQLFEDACQIAKSQENFTTKLDLLLEIVDHASPSSLIQEIEELIASEEFTQEPDVRRCDFLSKFANKVATHNLEAAKQVFKDKWAIDYIDMYQYEAIESVVIAMLEKDLLEDVKAFLTTTCKAHPDLHLSNAWVKIVQHEAQLDLKRAQETVMSIEDPLHQAHALIEYAKADPDYSLDRTAISGASRLNLLAVLVGLDRISISEASGRNLLEILVGFIEVAATRDVNQAMQKVLTLGNKLQQQQYRAEWEARAYIEIAKVDSGQGIPLAIDKAGEIEDPCTKANVFIKMAEVDPEESLGRLKPLISQVAATRNSPMLIPQIVKIEARFNIYDAIKTTLFFSTSATRESTLLCSKRTTINRCVDAILLALAKKDPETARRNVLLMRDPIRKVRLLSRLIEPPVALNVKKATRR